ncbi:MAG: citrate synthase [Erysipelotrichales bacterium]|nr:citrate synthase [Erysipelotrichales bacterium]
MNNFIQDFFERSLDENNIKNEYYTKYSVKKGLRNEDGTGVLVGLTKISDVVGYKKEGDKKVDDYGQLYYRGINVKDIVKKKKEKHRYLFEEVCFLILFGYLPNKYELKRFKTILSEHYELPTHYLEANILGFPARNLMNKLQQEVLMLYNYDKDADNIGIEETLQKGINLIAKIPSIVCYTYQTKVHYFDEQSLIIHHINKDYSIAELILSLLRSDGKFTNKEAEILDIALVLHVDHGGGNNSTFTNVVISSTGTDIYSAVSGAIGSLKGPRHGGANLAVKQQMDKVIKDIGVSASDEEIQDIVCRILDKNYNDNSGLIYGIGHAVYTLSDPRSEILAEECEELAIEKGRKDEFDFYQRFSKIAVEEIYKRKGIRVSTNVDFYSGLVYDMLGIPSDLYTLFFVIGRIVGWIAHNIENKLYSNRIIRPATQYVGGIKEYKDIEER